MPIKNPKQIFVLMLSDLRQGSEKTTSIFQNLAQLAEDADIKQALEARTFVSQKVVETLDQCFKLIGEEPVQLSETRSRIYDALAEAYAIARRLGFTGALGTVALMFTGLGSIIGSGWLFGASRACTIGILLNEWTTR